MQQNCRNDRINYRSRLKNTTLTGFDATADLYTAFKCRPVNYYPAHPPLPEGFPKIWVNLLKNLFDDLET